MALNGSVVRDTARVLGIGINTVISELKKENDIETGNTKLLEKRREKMENAIHEQLRESI